MSDDRFDANPYQSPEWPSEPTAADSGLLTEPIHLKGNLSLDEVLCAHGFRPGIVTLTIASILLGIGLLNLGVAIVIVANARTTSDVVGAICACVFGLILLWVSLMQSLVTGWLEPLWQEQRSVFAYREVTITDEAIETESGRGIEITKASWSDYACYRHHGNTVRLHLRRQGLKRRREQGNSEERQSRFGVNLQKIDVFPRHQFKDDGDWGRFLWVVKHKLKKKP